MSSIFSLNPVKETTETSVHAIPPDVKQYIGKKKSPESQSAIPVPILMYHYIELVADKKDTERQALNVTPQIFEHQLKTLIDAKYTFMTTKELGEVMDGKMTLPAKPIILTFDDGHRDFYTNAFPILEKYHVKATAYIISGFINKPDFMTQWQLQRVIASNDIDIGDHTIDHIALKGKIVPVLVREIAGSKKDLETMYNIHVFSFAYPSGSFDMQAIKEVQSAGYTTAVSTIPGILQSNINRFFLYRLRPGYRTGTSLLTFLQKNKYKT